jgi:hypothetical protein
MVSARWVLIVALATLGLAACGGSGGSARSDLDASSVAAGPSGSIQDILSRDPAQDVALVLGDSDFAVGENRITFLVVDQTGGLVLAPSARLLVAKGGLDAAPTMVATARALQVGAPAQAAQDGDFDAPSLFVAHVKLETPGKYTVVAEPDGKHIQAVGQIQVAATSQAPAVGDKAIASDTPTLANHKATQITTADPPDTRLLQYSIKQSLADHAPFVAVFATPKFCVSRVCGPVVSIVDQVGRKLSGSGVRFIHVEIYKDNDPEKGFNRWVTAWHLPTEPFTFVVDRKGVIRARFEGLVTAGELESAVTAVAS